MPSKTPNPTNSTLLQGLLEAIRQGKYQDSVLQAAITELSRNPGALKAVDQAVASKPYNEKRVTFYQAPVFDHANKAFQLSSAAYKMLHLMMASMAQSNIVRVDRKIYSDILGLKERQLRNLISEMVDLKVIAVVKPQSGHNSPEYMINPACGHRSKMPAALFKRFYELINDHYDPKAYRYTTGTEVPRSDPDMACGYLQDPPRKKEPSTSAKADSSSSDKTLDFTSHDSPPGPAPSSVDDGIPSSIDDIWAFREEDT